MKKILEEKLLEFIDEKYHEMFEFFDTKFGYSAKINSSVLIRIYTDIKSCYRLEFIKNADTMEYFKGKDIAKEKESVYQIDCAKKQEALFKTLDSLKEPISIQSNRIANNYHVDSFGCCGHYEECSNAKRCIMADVDKDFYRGCQYRKNLENGNIFYGKVSNKQEL